MEIDETYRPFAGGHIFGPKKEKIPITILRDTGASQINSPKRKKKSHRKKKSVKGIGEGKK